MIDVLGPEKRRRRTTQEKIAIVQQSFEPGMTVSLVARQHGVAASQLFLWRKQYQEGSLTACPLFTSYPADQPPCFLLGVPVTLKKKL
ncbi:transposase, partial [Escherichia coli]|uniref:transposase n=1 Tax=Escherichia coli TaxID=562 RepID=UPI000B0DC60C